MAKVKIGGNERVLQPFSAAKAMEAAALVTEIIDHGNGVIAAMDDYAVGASERATVSVPRAAAFYRDPDRAALVPDDAWKASGDKLELPGPRPGFEEQLIAVFPQVFRVARDQVLKLLALVLVDERELQTADEQGGADAIELLLAKQGRDLLYSARMEELLALGHGAWEVCREQLAADPTALALIQRLQALRSGPTTVTPSAPGSSTGSPARTGGPAKKRSTGSRGSKSEPSTVSS